MDFEFGFCRSEVCGFGVYGFRVSGCGALWVGDYGFGVHEFEGHFIMLLLHVWWLRV